MGLMEPEALPDLRGFLGSREPADIAQCSNFVRDAFVNCSACRSSYRLNLQRHRT